jgi:hypothetical protein
MAYISRALRQLVTERAGGLCEYCHTAQAIVIEMEIDHIVPEVAGASRKLGISVSRAFHVTHSNAITRRVSTRRPMPKCLYSTHVSSSARSISSGIKREHTSSVRQQPVEQP